MTNAPGAALLSAIRFTGFLTGAIYLAGTGEIVPGPRVLPTLSSPTRLSDTAFQFTVNGAAGERYAIQLSTTLTNNWISIQIITAPSDSFDVVDPNATNGAAFYRVLVNQ